MGRKSKPYRYVLPDGTDTHINGLWHSTKSNVWRITAAVPPIEFRTNDELEAIARFRQWEAQQKLKGAEKLAALTVKSRAEVHIETSKPVKDFVAAQVARGELTQAEAAEILEDILAFNWDESEAEALIPKEQLALLFRKWLHHNPKELAALCGMPQLANPENLKMPLSSPNLADMAEDYITRRKPVRGNEVRKIINDFMEIAKVRTLDDITARGVQAWGDSIEGREWAASTVRDWFALPKRVVSFGMTRAEYNKDQCRRALDELAILVAPEGAKTLDPQPISREHFGILLAHAQDAVDHGLLLAMLNLCMYPSEAAKLKWEEIDLDHKTVVAVRSKTEVVRIGVLWDRTITAIKSLSRKGEYVFTSNRGTHFGHSGLKDRFRRVKDAAIAAMNKAQASQADIAALEAVTMNHIRDGAYTAAIQGGATPDMAKLLAGHRVGIADHYVRRNPMMVAGSCEAIERHYLG